eukprot:g23349.t1
MPCAWPEMQDLLRRGLGYNCTIRLSQTALEPITLTRGTSSRLSLESIFQTTMGTPMSASASACRANLRSRYHADLKTVMNLSQKMEMAKFKSFWKESENAEVLKRAKGWQEKAVAQMNGMGASAGGVPPGTPQQMPMAEESPCSPASPAHLQVDCEFYKKKSEQLNKENESMRERLIALEQVVRKLQGQRSSSFGMRKWICALVAFVKVGASFAAGQKPHVVFEVRRASWTHQSKLLDQNETSMAPLPELVEKPTKATANKVRVGKGKPLPYGCSQAAKGPACENTVTFPDVQGSFLRFELQAPVNRTGNTWHIQIVAPFSLEGLRYGWHIDPEVSYDNQPLLEQPVLDPCARCLTSGGVEVWNKRGENIKYAPLSVVPDFRALDCFDWQGVTSPGYALQDLIIYEAHVRSFTKNKDSGEKIPHLLNLGINCVELLPIFEFDESQVPWKHPKTGEHLCQYWGYQTCSYNTPMQRFAVGSTKNPWAAIVEFKTLVRELHRNGIEVVLDVVFNHTGEGAWGVSNWNCLAKVAVNHYYLMSNGYHTNYTGCGNTLHANNPNCTEWIIDCLRYWALDMHVDGFRFDLASSLTRGSDGQCMPERFVCFLRLWDLKCYLVGQFPSGDGNPRWAEWNGKFRDAVRGFIKGDPNMKGEFATRVCGSADLYEPDGRGPCHSINFITAHDGFTLRDLVSYNKKHNHLNNEESGEDNNISWNCGEENDEGPSKKKDIMKLRDQQMLG